MKSILMKFYIEVYLRIFLIKEAFKVRPLRLLLTLPVIGCVYFIELFFSALEQLFSFLADVTSILVEFIIIGLTRVTDIMSGFNQSELKELNLKVREKRRLLEKY